MLLADGTVLDTYTNNTKQTAMTPAGSGGGGSPNSLLSAVEVILVLAILVFCIVFLVRFLKSKVISRSQGMLEVLDVRPLMQNRSIAVVKLANQIYVVGIGETIQLLDTIRDPDVIAGLGKPSEPVGVGFDAIFRDKLQRWTNQRKKLESWEQEQ
ncbi:MAG: flagellar protein [Bacilli bacterium]|nr:flagellar protein [Bacilli bacterium]